MVKVNVRVNATPSQQIINAANATVTVVDARGRKIEVRKTSMLDRLRLFEVIGSENSKNERYLGVAMFAYAVVSIDGEVHPTPDRKMELEAIVQKLDDDGYEAVGQAFEKLFPVINRGDDLKDQVKNA